MELEKNAANRMKMVLEQEHTWVNILQKEIQEYQNKIQIKEASLADSDTGNALIAWQKNQNRLVEISKEREELEQKKQKLDSMTDEFKNKHHSALEEEHEIKLKLAVANDKIIQSQNKIQEFNNFVKQIQNQKGSRCPTCFGIVAEENCEHASKSIVTEIENKKLVITEQQLIIKELQININEKQLAIVKFNEAITKLANGQKTINRKLSNLLQESEELQKIPRPDGNKESLLLEQEVNELKKQYKMRRDLLKSGKTPFSELVVEAINDHEKQKSQLLEKKQSLEELQNLMQYYDYWSEAFGDTGIRKWIIEGIIPALNEGVAYWLNILLDGIVTLKFDNELNAEIQSNPPDGDPYHYSGMSAGEHRMLNLSVSHAFAYVMSLSWGTSPSVVFLDEIGSNMDEVARKGVYNMICELAKDKQVFVTSHDHFLQELLAPFDTITVEKENGFTKIIA
jgi:DNA repair exonuclease SbcCD ATPase subunit